MRWFVSGSSTSVQSLVRKAGTLLEYPSITRELGESCIALQCPSYTNPIAVGVPVSLHACASDRERTTEFYPGLVESRLPGSHISSAARTLKNSAQCDGITSPREQYTEWKCTAADLTELWINTQRHAEGTRATHLALGGLQVTGVNPPAESLWDARHSSVRFVKALDVLFWNILAPKAGQHRWTRPGQTSGLHIAGKVLKSQNRTLAWLQISCYLPGETIWLFSEMRGWWKQLHI